MSDSAFETEPLLISCRPLDKIDPSAMNRRILPLPSTTPLSAEAQKLAAFRTLFNLDSSIGPSTPRTPTPPIKTVHAPFDTKRLPHYTSSPHATTPEKYNGVKRPLTDSSSIIDPEERRLQAEREEKFRLEAEERARRPVITMDNIRSSLTKQHLVHGRPRQVFEYLMAGTNDQGEEVEPLYIPKPEDVCEIAVAIQMQATFDFRMAMANDWECVKVITGWTNMMAKRPEYWSKAIAPVIMVGPRRKVPCCANDG